MQHRVCPRFFARMNVEVRFEGKRLGRFLTRDMSLFGVFLETRAVDLPSDRLLELSITTNGQLRRTYDINAVVVRREADGVGLRFQTEGYPRIYLKSLLFSASQVGRLVEGGRVTAIKS